MPTSPTPGLYGMAKQSLLTTINSKANDVVRAIAVQGRMFVATSSGIEECLPPNVVRSGRHLLVRATTHPADYRRSRLV